MNRISTGRRGVILLVILGMLALFMLVGVSFVVTSTHARSSALATMSVEQSGTSPERDISSALLSVVRGSRSPRSAIGPHSVLEDMYGERDGVVGVIRYCSYNIPSSLNTLEYAPSTSVPIFPNFNEQSIVNYDHYYSNGELIPVVAISFGPDRVPGAPGADDDGNGRVDDNYDITNDKLSLGQVPQGSDDFYLGHQVTPGMTTLQDSAASAGMGVDAIVGHYAGRVLTMLDGPLARQSTRIVWFYPVSSGSGGPCYWILVLRPFSPGLPSAVPSSGGSTLYNVMGALCNHRFVINGRPFNGQGFGYNPLNGMNLLTETAGPQAVFNPRLLNLSHYHLDMNPGEQAFPFALLPNPTDRRYRDYMADRSAYTSTGSPNGFGSDSYTVTPLTAYTLTAGMNAPSLSNPYGLDADEDYDAPDYQNLHMAWRVWNPMMGIPSQKNASTQAYPGGRWQTRIPSFHRPELVNYWIQMTASGALTNSGITNPVSSWPSSPQQNWNMLPGGESSGSGNPAPRLRQRIILRPDPQDNFDALTQDVNGNGRWDAAEPFQDVNGNGIWDQGEPHAFGTGNSYQQAEPDWSGNAYFNPINGPWDVDNDNDGEPDSVWLDLGAPVQTAPDGTEYKPLFAVLCLDMDGRLNINAHGSTAHVNYASYSTSAGLSSVPYNKNTGSSGVSDDSIQVGMWQVHTNQTGTSGAAHPPVYTRIQSVGPFAGGLQNPGSWTTSTTQYLSGSSTKGIYLLPTNTHSLSLATGLGFSVADVNLGPIFGPPFMTDMNNGSGGAFARKQSEYRFVLQGCPTASGNFNVATTSLQHLGQPIPGRYGEPHLLNYLYPAAQNGVSVYPQAGVTWGQFPGGAMGNFGTVYDMYDDNVPARGTPLMQVQTNPVNFRGNAYEATLPTPYMTLTQSQTPATYPAYPSVPTSSGIVTQGAYGSPADPFGCLMVGLDFRGQPVYANLPGWLNNSFIDDPWELDLSPRGKRTSYRTTGQTSQSFQSDAPFTPGELETLLRYGDPDLATLQSRPAQLFGLGSQDQQITTNLRNRITTESWDLPCPNIHPTPEIVKGLQMLGLPTTNCSFADLVRGKIAYVQGLNIQYNPPGNQSVGALALANQQALLLLTGRTILAGFQSSTGASITSVYTRTLPAFSSDLLQGLRMDLNRTFGNSWDDNGNGAIDDPAELTNIAANLVASSDQLWRLGPTNTNTTPYHPDPNNDGVANYSAYPTTAPSGTGTSLTSTGTSGPLAAYDVSARAEMAKHLYMLMMLLTDSDWMYWYPSTQQYLPVSTTTTTPLALGGLPSLNPNTSPTSMTPWNMLPAGYVNTINNPPLSFSPGTQPPQGGNPAYVMNAQQKMAAYRIAQWAVNAVDFADRDAIMTGFEFDLCPFNIDGWSVDGNLASFCSCWTGNPGSGGATLPPISYYLEPDRGVVWGMEYPDLLITETTAFHDKAWADTKLDTNTKNVTTATQKPDLDFDQVRLPQGSLFVELYCPGKPNSQSWATLANGGSIPTTTQANNNSPYLPTELYDVTTPVPTYNVGTGTAPGAHPWQNPVAGNGANNAIGNANVGTLDLERMTPYNQTLGWTKQYPVWRLALARATPPSSPPLTGTAPNLTQTTAPNPRPGASSTAPYVSLNPGVPQPPLLPSAAGPLPAAGQSVQNRFMTRSDTTTIMPYTSLSTHVTAAYSPRYLAVSKMATVPPTVPAHASQATSVTTAQLNAAYDSYVVTDFIDSTATNLPAHVVYLQRFVYFCRPVANAPNLYQPAYSLNNAAYPTLVYPPYLPNGNSVTSAPTPAIPTGLTAQAIYQFRPQTTFYGTSASGGAGTVQPRLLLHPGSYAVVGPRRSSHSPAAVQGGTYEDVTFVGYNDGTTIKTTALTTPGAVPAAQWYPQAIDLGTHVRPYHLLNPVMMLTPANGHANNNPMAYGGYPNNIGFMTTKIKNPLCIPCASGWPWPAVATTPVPTASIDRGLNISEPPAGYPATATASAPSTTSKYTFSNGTQVTVKDAYANPAPGTSSGAVPDRPFDAPTTAGGQSYEPWSAGPSGAGKGTSSRTLIDYSTVFLQRLADPTRPWDPTVNPYLTIDWMPIDLTVFNGQNVFQGTKVSIKDWSTDSASSGGPGTSSNVFAFETRQRGPRNMVQSTGAEGSLAGYPGATVTTATIPGLSGPTGAGTTAYYDPQPTLYRWPVTSYATAPFLFVIPTFGSTVATRGGANPWPPPSQVQNGYSNYTPYPAYNDVYCAVTEAPLWCAMSDDPRRTPAQANAPSPAMGAAGPSFTQYLYGTLGFLNEGYGVADFSYPTSYNSNLAAAPSPSAIDAPCPSISANMTTAFLYRLSSYYATLNSTSVATLYDYVGDPARPFPWLTWNNRPYASATELVLVPASQPARFGWEYNYKTVYTDRLAVHPDPYSMPSGGGFPPTPIPGGVLWDSHYAWRPNPPWGGLRPGQSSNSAAAYFTTTAPANGPLTGAMVYPPAPACNVSGVAATVKYSFANWPGPSVLSLATATLGGQLEPMLTAGGYPFGHLLNFFGSNGPQACTPVASMSVSVPYTAITANTSSGAPIDPLVGSTGSDPNFGGGYLPGIQPSSNFHRIFEYVHVPSRFSGTQELLDPVAFTVANPRAYNPNSSISHFCAPFNRVSRYREPGKVNLNTISDTWLKGSNYAAAGSTLPAPYYFQHQADIFQGMMNDFPGYQHIWDNLLGGLQVQDPRGADKAWGFARRYYMSPSATGDDDGQLSVYGFGQTDDQWEAGWPGWQASANNYPTLYSGNNASDDWIPLSSRAAQGQQVLVAGAPNERLLNHLAYNPNASSFTGPAPSAGDLPPGQGAYAIYPPGGSSGSTPINVGMPTFFPNPFRSFCTSFGVPVPQMLYWWPAVPALSGGSSSAPLNGNSVGLTTYPMPFYWADSSLFRRSRVHPTRRYEPLLVANSYEWWSPGVSGLPGASSGTYTYPSWETPLINANAQSLLPYRMFTSYPYPDAVSRVAPHEGYLWQPGEWGEGFRDTNRNPYFRYQPLIKLGNIATTRSNVYAIWVTVGYFQVQRARIYSGANNAAVYDRNPDGYRLVRELGSDTGNVKRHRGFAVFDRTLPVGFLRGENLNVNDAFLVKHMIE